MYHSGIRGMLVIEKYNIIINNNRSNAYYYTWVYDYTYNTIRDNSNGAVVTVAAVLAHN